MLPGVFALLLLAASAAATTTSSPAVNTVDDIDTTPDIETTPAIETTPEIVLSQDNDTTPAIETTTVRPTDFTLGPDVTCCIDLAFILDASRSVNVFEFEALIKFLNEFITDFDDPPFDVNIATITFSIFGDLEFNLDRFNTTLEVQEALLTIVPRRRKTNPDQGFEIALDEVFTDAGGDRNDSLCSDVIVFMSDGEANVGRERFMELATTLRDLGVTIISVAVDKIDFIENLVAVSSVGVDGPLILTDNGTMIEYNDLPDFSDELFETIINNTASCTPPPPPPPTSPPANPMFKLLLWVKGMFVNVDPEDCDEPPVEFSGDWPKLW